MSRGVSRVLAVTALLVALLALGLAAYAVSLGMEQREETRALGSALRAALAGRRTADLPMRSPPPRLETD